MRRVRRERTDARGMLSRMQKAIALLAVLACASCTNRFDDPPSCGDGTDPVIVTGLNGYLDRLTPAVEIQLRVPETCEVLDELWMVWEEDEESVVLVDVPDAELIERRDLVIEEDLILFTRDDLAVRLDYPTQGQQRELTLTWYTPPEPVHTIVDCVGEGESLACSVRTP